MSTPTENENTDTSSADKQQREATRFANTEGAWVVFLRGESEVCPTIPKDYFDADAEEVMTASQRSWPDAYIAVAAVHGFAPIRTFQTVSL
jgi:hypothetical protein